MILVIDAYNVLKAHERMHDIDQKQRHHFMVQLVTYAKKKNHTLVIVFDGGPYEWPFVSSISRGTLVYSGYNKTADDYIRRYLAQNKQYDLFLVSSDRELIRKAKQCNVHHMGGYEFFQKVKETLSVTQSHNETDIIKSTQRENEDLDALMEQAASRVQGFKKEDMQSHAHDASGKSHKKSKIERVAERKINKL